MEKSDTLAPAAPAVVVGQTYHVRGQDPTTGARYTEGTAVVLDVQAPDSAFDQVAAALLGAYLCRVRFTDGGDVGMRYVIATDLVREREQ